jgi:hypothetical protein
VLEDNSASWSAALVAAIAATAQSPAPLGKMVDLSIVFMVP